ncbi:hypothetical protein GCM10022248_89650 [Nonomuraea soli]
MTQTVPAHPETEPPRPGRGLLRRLRRAVDTALHRAGITVNRRTQQARQAQRQGPQAEFRLALELTAEFQLARPYLRAPFQQGFWQRITPERLGASWEAAASWAGLGDPMAHSVLEHLREQTARRYGITVDPNLTGREVTALLARVLRTANLTRAEADPGTVSLAIYDTERGTIIAHHEHVVLPPGIPAEQVAAEHLLQQTAALAQIDGQSPQTTRTRRYAVHVLRDGDHLSRPAVLTVDQGESHPCQHRAGAPPRARRRPGTRAGTAAGPAGRAASSAVTPHRTPRAGRLPRRDVARARRRAERLGRGRRAGPGARPAPPARCRGGATR